MGHDCTVFVQSPGRPLSQDLIKRNITPLDSVPLKCGCDKPNITMERHLCKECACGSSSSSPETNLHCCDDNARTLDIECDEKVDQVPVNNNNTGITKTLVNKCFSDPSSIRVRTSRYQSGATTRKCVLTLDGYSYVIGNAHNPCLIPNPKIG